MKRPRKLRRRIFSALCLAFAAFMLFVAAREPSLNREWDDDVAVLANVTITASGAVQLTNVRDWSYSEKAVTSKRYFDQWYDPANIVDAWMYEQLLDPTGLIAHTFVVFEFDGDRGTGPADTPDGVGNEEIRDAERRFIGLSVETRRQAGEKYSIVGGMLRKFEIAHIWATEDDLVRRRVEHLDYPLTRYRLLIPDEIRRKIFTRLAVETSELARVPKWYNTATNNCTSSLVRYVNESVPGAIPWHPSHVLTGRIDEQLARLGYLDRASSTAVTRDVLVREGVR